MARKSLGHRRRKIFSTKGNSCVYCGDTATVIDHFVPVNSGGGNEDDNLLPSCVRCNALARDNFFHSLPEKRAYILERREQKDKVYEGVVGGGDDRLLPEEEIVYEHGHADRNRPSWHGSK